MQDVTASAHAAHDEEFLCHSKLVELFSIILHQEGIFERQIKYNNINNVRLSVYPLVKLFVRSKV
ncbi:hypothetical protein SFRURICE_001593 [Spodoptera frugiperda]|nr:hypothetical protein SFRURICE_001593 [Spodoptera frugiperda]